MRRGGVKYNFSNTKDLAWEFTRALEEESYRSKSSAYFKSAARENLGPEQSINSVRMELDVPTLSEEPNNERRSPYTVTATGRTLR